MKKQLILIALLINVFLCYAQPKDVPPLLKTEFPAQTLGEKLQNIYQVQAKSPCQIIRKDQRMYIPQEILDGFGETALRSTKIFPMPMSATNVFFLALSPQDVEKIQNSTFIETEYIAAKKIIGISDNFVDYGKAGLSPINGFPSLFYQKSCGSYFEGKINADTKLPWLELKASLEAETKKTSVITTVTGKFFSPLYLILRDNNIKSVYAHLLIWDLYYNDIVKNPKSDFYKIGQYISEFDGTLINEARNSKDGLGITGRMAANVSLGVFAADGSISTGYDTKAQFSLNDFQTFLHRLSNGKLAFALSDLPSLTKINEKLQNSLSSEQPSITNFVNNIVPVQITRTLSGIPSTLCSRTSWEIKDGGYDTNVWEKTPVVTSAFNSKNPKNPDGLPECICTITGKIKTTYINLAVAEHANRDINLKLTNIAQIGSQALSVDIVEPSVKFTDAPKTLPVSSDGINASRKEVAGSNSKSHVFSFPVYIDDTGISLSSLTVRNIQIQYLNTKDEALNLIVESTSTNGKSLTVQISTPEKPIDYVVVEDRIIPVKVTFSLPVANNSVSVVTNVINLKIPIMDKKAVTESKTASGN